MSDVIDFKNLTPDQQQSWVDVWIHEKYRHFDDINKINGYLESAKQLYGITPRHVWIDKWIEI